jgi:hypothetical protein
VIDQYFPSLVTSSSQLVRNYSVLVSFVGGAVALSGVIMVRLPVSCIRQDRSTLILSGRLGISVGARVAS